MLNDPNELELRVIVESWHEATRAGDVARVLSLIDEDAVFLRAGGKPIRGRAEFGRQLRELLKTHQMASSVRVQEVKVSGDLGYCWSELSVKITPLNGGDPKVRTGPALSIFKRQTGRSWVLLRDANMLAPDSAELELKVDNLEREIMADGPGGD